ncbi:P-loop containing nucleoside triphosphate hydrolase protein, partial [Ephemerocybe angulata]
MPTHTVHYSLFKLFVTCNEAPWCFPTWQEITGVDYGLFPQDDELLPLTWNRDMADDIARYFDALQAKATEDDRVKFSAVQRKVGNDNTPGRALWRKYITDNYDKRWNIHTRIANVLTDVGIHPSQLMAAQGDFTDFPAAHSYLPVALDPIALALFGHESFDKAGHLRKDLRESTLMLGQRTWDHLRKINQREWKHLEKAEAAMEKALKDLDRDKLTKRKLTSLIRHVGKWHAIALEFDSAEQLAKIEEIRGELDRLMDGLGQGGNAKPSRSPKGIYSYHLFTTQALQSLASKEDVSDLGHLYDTFFSDSAVDDGSPRDFEAKRAIAFAQPVAGADPGVEVEAGMTVENMCTNLGFLNGLPFIFVRVRHAAGLTMWDYTRKAGVADPLLSKLSLHDHQVAGVHALVRKLFVSKETAGHWTGILCADEVGLGKTLQSITAAAFLIDLCTRQLKNLPLPPIIQEKPYLASHRPLPSLPTLIVVPGTLLSQWEHELKVAFKPRSIDILLYGSGLATHKAFWLPNGPYETSAHPPHNRVILASHTALWQDFGVLYGSFRPPRSMPWDHPSPLPGHEVNRLGTLYGKNYLTTIFDEAHEVRNNGPRHSSALMLLERSIVRLPCTATPLQTSTRDLAAMGRLVGIPYFSSPELRAQERQDTTELRHAKLEKGGEEELEEGEMDGGGDSNDPCPVQAKESEISNRIFAKYEGHVIRRTAISKRANGEDLIPLPPMTIVHGFVSLTEREADILDALTLENMEAVASANGRNRGASRFYIEHRMGVTFARSKEDLDNDLPKFESLAEWEPVKSTKIDTLVRILHHLLSRDDAPPVLFENGAPVFPDMPPTDPENPPTKTNKIIVFQEWVTFRPLVQNILRLYGITSVHISGRTSLDRRGPIISQFTSDPTCRVLLLSKVGNVGLNLTVANTVIFLDQPWSAQDEHQIRGRIHRHGQTRPCTSYQLLALDTADVTMSRISGSKKNMLKSF